MSWTKEEENLNGKAKEEQIWFAMVYSRPQDTCGHGKEVSKTGPLLLHLEIYSRSRPQKSIRIQISFKTLAINQTLKQLIAYEKSIAYTISPFVDACFVQEG